MSDVIDEANAVAEAERGAIIARAADQVARPGAIHCEDCDRAIPEARRAAAPFAIRCIECQTKWERA